MNSAGGIKSRPAYYESVAPITIIFLFTCGRAFAAGGNAEEGSCDGSSILMSKNLTEQMKKTFLKELVCLLPRELHPRYYSVLQTTF